MKKIILRADVINSNHCVYTSECIAKMIGKTIPVLMDFNSVDPIGEAELYTKDNDLMAIIDITTDKKVKGFYACPAIEITASHMDEDIQVVDDMKIWNIGICIGRHADHTITPIGDEDV